MSEPDPAPEGDETSQAKMSDSSVGSLQTNRFGVRILNEVEKAWLAGVIDGEGAIPMSKAASCVQQKRVLLCR